MSRLRILVFSIGALGVFLISPWVTLASAAILALRWRAWEVILLGVLTDALWLPSTFWYGFPLATLTGVCLVWALEPVRNELLVDYSTL